MIIALNLYLYFFEQSTHYSIILFQVNPRLCRWSCTSMFVYRLTFSLPHSPRPAKVRLAKDFPPSHFYCKMAE